MLARRLRQGSVYLHGRNRSLQGKAVTCRHLDSVRSPAPTEIERLLASTDTSATTNQIQICGFLLQVSKTLQACSIQNAIQEYAILRQRRVMFARGSAGSVFGREGGREVGRSVPTGCFWWRLWYRNPSHPHPFPPSPFPLQHSARLEETLYLSGVLFVPGEEGQVRFELAVVV